MLGQPPETRPIEPAWTRRSLGWRQVRELALWVVVVAGVLNFTPTLLSGEPVNETALWTKAAKDIPLLLLLAVVAAEARSRVLPTRRPARTLALAACAMGAYILASVIASGAPSAGEAVSLRYYVVYPLVAVALASVPFGTRELDRLFALVVVLALLESVIAVPNSYGFPTVLDKPGLDRAVATLGNPNTLGLFVGLGIIVTAAYVGRWPRWACAAAIAVMLVGLAFTFSKTAPVALALSSLALFRVRVSGRRALLAAGVIAVGVLLSAAVFALRDHQQLSPAGSTDSFVERAIRSLGGTRSDDARQALDDWTESPRTFVVGSGFGALADIEASGRLREDTVDNMALALAVEGGLGGLLMFAGVIVAAVWPLFRKGPRLPVVRIARAYAIFFLLYIPVAINFRIFPPALFFWILVGIAFSVIYRETRDDAGPSAPDSA